MIEHCPIVLDLSSGTIKPIGESEVGSSVKDAKTVLENYLVANFDGYEHLPVPEAGLPPAGPLPINFIRYGQSTVDLCLFDLRYSLPPCDKSLNIDN